MLDSLLGRTTTETRPAVTTVADIEVGRATLFAALAAVLRRAAGTRPLVLVVDDCRAAYEEMHKRGVEFTQEPTERFGNVDASFRGRSGNGWKMLQASTLSSRCLIANRNV